jgi:hypothetical protein
MLDFLEEVDAERKIALLEKTVSRMLEGITNCAKFLTHYTEVGFSGKFFH